jgi:hypothetical protein
MTVLGKILIVLNLLAAVLVGGMLIFHAATEPNWALGTDKLQSEVTASRTNSAAKEDEAQELRKKVKELTQTLDNVRKTFDEKENGKDGKGGYKGMIRDNNNQTLQARLKTLLVQLDNLNKRLVKAESGVGGGTAALTRSPNADNPPPVDVKGVITNIIRDRGLVEISIGSDDGVNTGHTLVVYRLKPRPEFLGKIRILDAEHHKAVGQVMKTDAVRHSAMARGDEVASSITARNR